MALVGQTMGGTCSVIILSGLIFRSNFLRFYTLMLVRFSLLIAGLSKIKCSWRILYQILIERRVWDLYLMICLGWDVHVVRHLKRCFLIQMVLFRFSIECTFKWNILAGPFLQLCCAPVKYYWSILPDNWDFRILTWGSFSLIIFQQRRTVCFQSTVKIRSSGDASESNLR